MQKAMRLRVCCPVVHGLLREQLHPQIRKLLPSQTHRVGLSVRTQAVQQQTEVQLQERRQAEKQSSTANGAPAPQTHLTFQEAISTLEQYWAKQSGLNCAILLPHNTEVGAGTMNPSTFLRVCGPEPWNVCYPEPSVRPDDSRYGQNPNRVQRHTQFQVILKPDPGNPQELYLGSLQAIGVDVAAHDIRFVEDNWESPVLGAWGLGWEVWCDGQEITQFTYFQQAGGKSLDYPAIEITYGLERILMALQGVNHFKDIQYTSTMTYGELFLQHEYEMSCYNLDEADVEGQRKRFDLYNQEAKVLLKKRLPVPAYDHLLKLSHTFNIMDARGAVGVTERAECFGTLRALARQITGLWMARREELGHPLGTLEPLQDPPPQQPEASTRDRSGQAEDFVLELGCEELPPEDLDAAIEQLQQKVPELLSRLRLQHAGIRVQGTPRRLAVLVASLACQQPDAEDRVRGPPAKVAFSAEGAPTKALEGFCKKNRITPEDVSRQADAKGVEYVWATVRQPGQSAAQVLSEELPAAIAGLSFKRSMRWNGKAAFSRPLRWLLALHGSTVLPFVYAGLRAGGRTRLLRTSTVTHNECQGFTASEYQGRLWQGAGIVLDGQQRQEQIWGAVLAEARHVLGTVPDNWRQDLVPEVANLVEAPAVLRGSFDPKFLDLPQEVLVMVMRKHQRYFPVFAEGSSSQLLPHFITVANSPVDPSVIQAGNEAVLRARFEDAAFFFGEDLKQPLEDFRPLLRGTTFQRDLGSLFSKSERVEQLVPQLAKLALPEAAEKAQAAARLAMNDLATSTVTEMTALAGVFGRILAQRQGQDAAVADAIYESTLPRSGSSAVATSPAGILVSLSDKLDSLVGLIAAGCAPTASTDQYGVRRIAYGLLETLLASSVSLDLPSAVQAAAQLQPIPVSEQQQQQVLDFASRRLEQLLLDRGYQIEAVRAVMQESNRDPARVQAAVQQLQGELRKGDSGLLHRVMTAFSRPTRIVRGKDVAASWQVREDLFELEEEPQLLAAFQRVQGQVQQSQGISNFLSCCEDLVEPLNAYFEKVFVMTDNEAVRQSRLALLRDVATLPSGILSLAELPGF